jgi:hypothetical protein
MNSKTLAFNKMHGSEQRVDSESCYIRRVQKGGLSQKFCRHVGT